MLFQAAFRWGWQERTTAPRLPDRDAAMQSFDLKTPSAGPQCRNEFPQRCCSTASCSQPCWALPAAGFSQHRGRQAPVGAQCSPQAAAMQHKHPLHSPRESRKSHSGGFSWQDGFPSLPPSQPSQILQCEGCVGIPLYCPGSCRRAVLSFFMLLTLSDRPLSRQARHL